MKIVALISGGKDSCFNVLHCVANGHDVVALANLHPAADAGDELDSHMYQTVGHDVIPLYAKCFRNPGAPNDVDPLAAPDLPMFRRAIAGASANIGMTYDHAGTAAAGNNHVVDEVEDLYLLLKDVVTAMPDVKGVSVGAILSSYQRVRVENVCQRLGLQVFGYLWQGDQVELLASMVSAGMNSILIKVAAMGLDRRHLGKSLMQLQPHLLKMHAQFDLHPCGEGGEYETITLDCPVFRRRLVVKIAETIAHSDDEIAPVLYQRLVDVEVEDKTDLVPYEQLRADLRAQLVPDTVAHIVKDAINFDTVTASSAVGLVCAEEKEAAAALPQVKIVGSLLAVTGIRAPSDVALEDAARHVMEQLAQVLQSRKLDTKRHLIMVTVLVKDMADFAHVNAIYGQYFGVNPAARACIQAVLPCQVQVDALAVAHATVPRDNLHVQSISYWAAANIGPYSQSCTVGSHVFVAGQIGLVPETMAMPALSTLTATFQAQAHLSLRHLTRIYNALRVSPTRDVVACVAYVSSPQWLTAARQVWTAAMDAPVLAVAVPRLPRDALVEWVAVAHHPEWRNQYNAAHSRLRNPLDSDDEEDAPIVAARNVMVRAATTRGGDVTASRNGTLVTVMARGTVSAPAGSEWTEADVRPVLADLVDDIGVALAKVQAEWQHVLSLRVFYLAEMTAGFETVALQVLGSLGPISFAPCTGIASRAHFALFLHANVE
ncbi:hypothetical protein AMAG_08703 [Allomyces macrogynus ATCC 38327]|uniref:Diphthine--ammonia ligase n=1 Tax=Allomyces macrogynus (strain ATCC 38327) TaxID=578462 RepID=A0A0L0SMJ7_ALLM3|nr:hypothetical protein AMAG_08703 [Allomyces macrogynus ATCC 38327]|eukprot:KNE63599.1 hypothetical protein AMAG_08703 [Allomyces macrogynus ATCC 38327]